MRLGLSVQSLLSHFEQRQCSQILSVLLPAQLRTAIIFPFQLKIFLVPDSADKCSFFFLCCPWVLMTNETELSGLLCLLASRIACLALVETYSSGAFCITARPLQFLIVSYQLTEQLVYRYRTVGVFDCSVQIDAGQNCWRIILKMSMHINGIVFRICSGDMFLHPNSRSAMAYPKCV